MSELRVALTFDAEHPDRPWCPPANAQRILGELARVDVPATFFVQGRWAKAHPDEASTMNPAEALVKAAVEKWGRCQQKS